MSGSGTGGNPGRDPPASDFLFEHTTDCIVEGVVENGEPIVSRVNGAFEEVFGYAESELRGENLNDFVAPDGRRSEVEAVDREVREGDVGPREVTRLTVEGPREFLFRATGGEGERSYAIYTDITEQKERERQLRAANERLERSNERLERVVRVVSHDLRNPIEVAHSGVERARRGRGEAPLDDVENALDRMDAIIEDLLARAAQDAPVERRERVSLSRLARVCWESVETGDASLYVADPPSVVGDPGRLRQLLANLYRNGVRHGGDGVTITVGATPTGFFVEDDGVGIPPGRREEVFEPGYTTASDGTGFGLDIVREIARAHGWTVEATDGSDGGARFEFSGLDDPGVSDRDG